MQNLNSDNADIQFVLSTICYWELLKRTKKIIGENASKQKKLGLKFNPGLALITLPTTGPWLVHLVERQTAVRKVEGSLVRTNSEDFKITKENV